MRPVRGLCGLCGLRALALLLGAATLVACAPAPSPEDMVSLEAARTALAAGQAVMVDLREPEEHATGVAAGARLLPLQQLAQRWQEIPADPAQPVLLICQTQNRSSAALRLLRERGYAHVRYVHGGMSGWAQRGWPMVPPSRAAGAARDGQR
jgi:rhodanese-related sulfurtransferase